MKFVYLATPYSKYPKGIEAAFIDACALTGELLTSGIRAYSPIAHTHPIAIHAKIDPYAHNIWIPFDQAMMDASAAIVVAKMDSWEISFGIQHERDYFKAVNKPEFLISLKPTAFELEQIKNFMKEDLSVEA